MPRPLDLVDAGDRTVSGSRFVIVGPGVRSIFDGAASVTEPAITSVAVAIGVPHGFLVAISQPPRARPVVLGTAHALPANATAPVVTFERGGRVTVMWTEAQRVHTTVLDADGTTLVADSILFTDGPVRDWSVTVDGAHLPSLARVEQQIFAAWTTDTTLQLTHVVRP